MARPPGDLKDSGLAHCPSGRFFANAAHLACAALARNIARWTARLGHTQHPDRLTVAATTRNRLLTARPRRQPQPPTHPAHARCLALAHTWTQALRHIRNLPLLI